MRDVGFVLLIVGFFVMTWWFVIACARAVPEGR